MLGWALGFFILAIVAAALGFGGIAGASAGTSADCAESTMPTAVGTVVLPSAPLESEDSTTAGLPRPVVSTGGAKASSSLFWIKEKNIGFDAALGRGS